MAYLRWGEILPSGAKSRFFVIGDTYGILNYHGGGTVFSYKEFRQKLNSGDVESLKRDLGSRIALDGEELDFFFKKILEEKARGEWDKPFDFEAK